jgi:hypothetical protein
LSITIILSASVNAAYISGELLAVSTAWTDTLETPPSEWTTIETGTPQDTLTWQARIEPAAGSHATPSPP